MPKTKLQNFLETIEDNRRINGPVRDFFSLEEIDAEIDAQDYTHEY